jgi:hypothetical protein
VRSIRALIIALFATGLTACGGGHVAAPTGTPTVSATATATAPTITITPEPTPVASNPALPVNPCDWLLQSDAQSMLGVPVNVGRADVLAGSCIYYASTQPTTTYCSAAMGFNATACVDTALTILNSVTFADATRSQTFQTGSGFGYTVTAYPVPGTDEAYSVVDTVPWSKHPTVSLDVTLEANVYFAVEIIDPLDTTEHLEVLEGAEATYVLHDVGL